MRFVGIVNNVPLSGDSGKSAATVKGHLRLPGESPRGHYSYGVDGDYFAAMGFSLREGRFLTADDSRRSSSRVCVVDEDFARYYWPGGGAIGQRLFAGSKEGTDAEAFTVAGVVGSVKQADLTDDTAQGAIYYPYAFRSDNDLFVVVRADVPPESLAPTLQGVVSFDENGDLADRTVSVFHSWRPSGTQAMPRPWIWWGLRRSRLMSSPNRISPACGWPSRRPRRRISGSAVRAGWASLWSARVGRRRS